MHVSGTIAVVVWMDKKSVLMASTSAPPIAPLGASTTVPRFVGTLHINNPTSPIHLEYTTYMRGVDVGDELCGTYSTLPKTHKWWHCLFFFLLDTSMVSAWLIHCAFAKDTNVAALTHLEFRLRLAEEL